MWKSYIAELLGTFILATVVLISLTPSTPFPVPTPIAAAMTLTLCVYLFGSVSGCHINPAVSFSMWLTRQLNASRFVVYLLCQVAGAGLAYGLISLYVLPGQESWLPATHSTLYSGVGEAIGAMFFVFGVTATGYLKYDRSIQGIIVGLSLLVGITVSHNASYGVLNPAVALAAKAWSWHYLLAPFVGASVGGIAAKCLLQDSVKEH